MKVWVDANPLMAVYLTEEDRARVQYLEKGRTSNEAEYEAILLALIEVKEVTVIFSDSQVAINQLNHAWHISEDRLRKYAVQIWNLTKGKVKFEWTPRKQNKAGMLLK